MFILFLIYWLLPNCKIRPREIVRAAIVVGLLLEALKYVNLLLWPLMRAMCNRLVHAYFSVDPQIVWDTIYHDLLPLVPLLGASAAAPGALCSPALDTVGRRDRPRLGAVCPLVRLVSGGGAHLIGDRPRPDPVWETAGFSVPPAPTAVLPLCPTSGGCHDTPPRLFS